VKSFQIQVILKYTLQDVQKTKKYVEIIQDPLLQQDQKK